MKTKHLRTMTLVSMFVLLLLVVPLMARPVRATATAGASATAPDIARIDGYLRAQVQRNKIPGLAIALVDGERIVHMRGYGAADHTGRAVTPQTPFVLASVSKPITALAVMQLVETGTLELDAPVQRYLPEFRLADPVASRQMTLRQLLLHTSGIPVTSCDTRIDADTLAQYVAELQTVQPAHAPGTRHAYCSGNYNVLGRVIEVVTGSAFGAYIQRHVFAPLGMRHSYVAEHEARADGLAQGHRWIFGLPVPYHDRYNPSQLPSGYLVSSAEDLAHFLIAQLNGGVYGDSAVLSPAGIAAMHVGGGPPTDGSSDYGLGWISGTLGGVPAVWHDGTNPGYHTLVFMEPGTRRGAVILINAFGILPYMGVYKEIEADVARLLAGQEPAPLSALSIPQQYVAVDAVLGGLLALALWPLVRLRRWAQRLRQQHEAGSVRRLPLALRLAWEFGAAIVLLGGARMLLHLIGAQSWREGLSVFPDFAAWIWAMSLIMLLRGVLHVGLLRRELRRRGDEPSTVSPRTTQFS